VPRLGTLAIALVALVVYLIQTPPVSGDKDSGEFTLVLALNGIAHPTGYPIYTLLGHLFVRALHALGAGWVYAANSWSAVGGAVAIYFLHRLSLGLIPESAPLDRRGRFLLASLPVALLAFNPLWTVETTLAEVHGWAFAWVCGATCLFLSLVRRLCGPEAPPPAALTRGALGWGIVCGLGGAHHAATGLLFAAPLSLGLAWSLARAKRLRFSDVSLMLLAALVPLLSYGAIAYRAFHPALMQWPVLAPSWGSVLDHILGTQYRGGLGVFSPSPEQRVLLARYCWPFLFPGLALWLAAPWLGPSSRERVPRAAIAMAVALGIAFTFQYGFNDPSSYFIAPLGLGLAGLVPAGAALATRGPKARRLAVVTGALVALAAGALSVSWLRVGQARVGLFVGFDQTVHSMWASIPVDSGIVFWPNDMYSRLHEYQWLRGEKRGLTVIHPINLVRDRPRQLFREQFGFDPIEGVVVALGPDGKPSAGGELGEVYFSEVYQRINRMTRLPVILFDPASGSVRMLRKPGAPAADASAAPAGAPARGTMGGAPLPGPARGTTDHATPW
jgi:hypothetical protein